MLNGITGASDTMKKYLYIMLGWLLVATIAVSFGACEKKSNGADDPIGGGGGEQNQTASIVGTWKRTVNNSYYGPQTYIFTLNANNKGTFTTSSSEGSSTMNLVYNFNSSTNTGTVVMTDSYYGYSYTYAFRVEWFGTDNINIYIRYQEDGYAEEWENMGLFERQ